MCCIKGLLYRIHNKKLKTFYIVPDYKMLNFLALCGLCPCSKMAVDDDAGTGFLATIIPS